MLQYQANAFGYKKDFYDTIGFRAVVGSIVSLFFYFPLSLKKDLSVFRSGGLITVILLIYIAIVMLAELPLYI